MEEDASYIDAEAKRNAHYVTFHESQVVHDELAKMVDMRDHYRGRARAAEGKVDDLQKQIDDLKNEVERLRSTSFAATASRAANLPQPAAPQRPSTTGTRPAAARPTSGAPACPDARHPPGHRRV